MAKKKGGTDSPLAEMWKIYRRNKSALVGLVIAICIVLIAIFADLIVPYSVSLEQNAAIRLMPPSADHWFGTDEFGRDLFARVIHGSRFSIAIGLGATVIALFLGTVIGAICGLYGGLIDQVIMRLCDVISCIPFMILALAVVAALGPSLINLMIAMTVACTPGFTRMIRSVILSIVEQDYMAAATVCGTKRLRSVFKHVIPNATGPIIVQGSMSVAAMILTAAGLSYIGMGVNPPTPEWGSMLNASTTFIRQAPHLLIFSGVAIALAALSMNLVGDGLRDAMDPRYRF